MASKNLTEIVVFFPGTDPLPLMTALSVSATNSLFNQSATGPVSVPTVDKDSRQELGIITVYPIPGMVVRIREFLPPSNIITPKNGMSLVLPNGQPIPTK